MRYLTILSLLVVLACGENSTAPNRQTENYRLAYFKYTDKYGEIGPKTRGDFGISVDVQSDSLAYWTGRSDSGYAATYVEGNDDEPDQYFRLIGPGRYEGVWHLKADSVSWASGRSSLGWLAAFPWRWFRPDSLVAEWDSTASKNEPWRLHARFERTRI